MQKDNSIIIQLNNSARIVHIILFIISHCALFGLAVFLLIDALYGNLIIDQFIQAILGLSMACTCVFSGKRLKSGNWFRKGFLVSGVEIQELSSRTIVKTANWVDLSGFSPKTLTLFFKNGQIITLSYLSGGFRVPRVVINQVLSVRGVPNLLSEALDAYDAALKEAHGSIAIWGLHIASIVLFCGLPALVWAEMPNQAWMIPFGFALSSVPASIGFYLAYTATNKVDLQYRRKTSN